MNRRSSQKRAPLIARLGRLAMTLGAAFALGGAASAQTGPVASSPTVPSPYQSPVFHAGGALTPPPPPPGGVYTAQPGQLQGTPTDIFGGVPTEIPSFLLGDYNPAFPPVGAGVYYPEHFADGDVYSWQAPFDYITLTAGTVTVDDSSPAPVVIPTPTSGFAATATFVNVTSTPATSGDLPANTATGGEYDRLPPNVSGTAVWTFVAAAPGNFSVYFHIPDNIADSAGAVEPRSTSVEYTITVSGANPQTATATASQTEANSTQFLAGPFQLAANDTVTVTLRRDLTHNQTNAADYLIADSMTLQATIGDVQSTPTAINYESYPTDFAKAQYWGIYTPPGGVPQVSPLLTGTAAMALAQNANPDTVGGIPAGAIRLRYGNPAATQPDGTTVDVDHRIRQLVYFGRSEPVINYMARVDNSDAAFAPTPAASWLAVTDATATNGSYVHAAPTNGAASATAAWTLVAPNLGNYYLSVHLPFGNIATETRISDATYHVTVNATVLPPVSISQVQTSGADSAVILPTGPLHLAKGDVVTVTLDNTTANALTAKTFVVADSITLSSGTGQGAIYCVDGFTGGVLWRFETPGSPVNGPSAPVFSAPAVAKINVLVTPAGPGGVPAAVYANKLVVIVGDNNGMVYCLDAIGNGDGTSNANVIDPTTGQPITLPQPGYGTTPAAFNSATPHVGTTSVYWIYRPDPRYPKDISTHAVKAVPDPLSDLPVPAAFGPASPTIFVDPSKPITPTAATDSNAIVYVGNSNGVLYALDAIGVAIDGTSLTTSQKTGDTFNASLDLRNSPGIFPSVANDAIVPSCQPLWWFTLRGPSPATAATAADIESAPAIYVTKTAAAAYVPTVYIGSAHELESTSNVGRLYAINGLYGPSGNGGKSDPRLAAGLPGTPMYNVDQRPTLPTVAGVVDTADWTFPDRDGTQPVAINSSQQPRPALGNITGSPVVFTDFNETGTNADGTSKQTRIYFAANSGLEVPVGTDSTTVTTAPTARPGDTTTGRVWAVNLDGSLGTTTNTSGAGANPWVYPLANDPNNAAKDKTPEPQAPVGAFLHMTPAVGFVQFPSQIDPGSGTYTPADVIQASLKGQSIPMLYFGTRGVDDTQVYAVDIDGGVATTTTANVTSVTTDQRTIYHQISPDGAIFQSSPILITNSTSAGGNGGSLLIVAGDTLYDFSATPISNPDLTQAFPLIRENKALIGFGPLSSPAVAATNVADLFIPALGTPDVTDWVYVGDSSTGFCRGITPQDSTDGGIPPDLGDIVPPSVDAPTIQDLSSIIQTYLVDDAHAGSTKALPNGDALPVGLSAPLPVYEWNQNVYIRFTNVVPPNPVDLITQPTKPLGDPLYFVHDSTLTAADFMAATMAKPITFFTNPAATPDNGIKFTLTDATEGASVDNGAVPPTPPGDSATPLVLPGDGFVRRSDTVPAANLTDNQNKLIDGEATPKRWIGAYTYAISDGTARRNTPGGRRRVQDASQTVSVVYFTNKTGTGDITDPSNFVVVLPNVTAPITSATTTILRATVTNGNEVSVLDTATGKYGLKPVGQVDQPTFGILNPLGIRAGGIPLSLTSGSHTNAVEIGNELGPFRGVAASVPIKDPMTGVISSGANIDPLALEALAQGNDIYQGYAPPSSSGSGLNPTTLTAPNTTFTPQTAPEIVVTSTGLIPNNSSGDNADTSGGPAPPSGTFVTNGTSDQGILPSVPFGSVDRPYALDVFDRSPLGLAGKVLKVKMEVTPGGHDGIGWNDNHIFNNATGHDAVVNYLPWETIPVPYTVGANTSPDYPDIGSQFVTITLHADDNAGGGTANLVSDSAVATPATPAATVPAGTTALQDRIVTASPVQVHIDVPRFQPANQQLYSKPSGQPGYNPAYEIGPLNPDATNAINSGNDVFPMGYVTTRRIYVPNQYGRYDGSTAYRDVRVYTGVPISMATSMADGTVDIGKGPAGLGIQTSQFPGYKDAANNVGFTPYNAQFQNYFLPLTIHNDGNVNLLNVHLDQKYGAADATGKIYPQSLTMTSDPLDPLSDLPGYDFNGVTGPYTAPALPFLIRSSLDTDLVALYGHNPGVVAATDPVTGLSDLRLYPGATFHKALPGSAAPSTLTVPDAPETPVPGASLTYSQTPTLATAPNGLPYKSPPFVSVAIPFGTPVGSYSHTLRVFEGMDLTGYTTYAGAAGLSPYNPFYPPNYGGAIGGLPIGTIKTPKLGTVAANTDKEIIDPDPLTDPSGINGNREDVFKVGLQPAADPGVVLRATVLEDRITDGYTNGALPQFDSPFGGPPGHPDFAPAAFREWSTRNLYLYWTSGRDASGATLPFNIFGAYVDFFTNPAPAFMAETGGQRWWRPINMGFGGNALFNEALAGNPPVHSGLTIAQDQPVLSGTSFAGNGGAYAFDVAVKTPPYQNNLYCYPIMGGLGTIGPGQLVTNDPGQIKYGVHGLYLSSANVFANNLWAFWTASTGGRTAIYYNSRLAGSGDWPQPSYIDTNGNGIQDPNEPIIPATGLLPVPAGLTSVADASPMLLTAPVIAAGGGVGSATQSVIEVTYSGTAPDGNVDLYESRYAPAGRSNTTAPVLNLVSFPTVTERLTPVNGWYQARDVAWSRTGALNITVGSNPILYNGTTPLFTKAVFDKASGLLVLTGVTFSGAAGGPVTVYVDGATGRVRFTQPPPAGLVITATFNPLARRLTTDARSDVGPVTFLDPTFKENDAGFYNAANAAKTSPVTGIPRVQTDRRWYVWRKSGATGDAHSATLYFKTQRLTFFLPTPIALDSNQQPIVNVTLGGNVVYDGTTPTQASDFVDVDWTRGRIYFPINIGGTLTEGRQVTVTYMPAGGTSQTIAATPTNTIQWQDEQRANDSSSAPPTDSASGLATLLDYALPIDTIVNESNVAAFLDTDAYYDLLAAPTAALPDYPHKVWLFWNSTRNAPAGSSDLYYETIDPRFSVGP